MEVISSSQVDAWTEAAKAKGGVQRVWVRSDRVTPWDPWEIIKKRQKGYGVDVLTGMKEACATATRITFDKVRSANEPARAAEPSREDRYEGRTFVENEDKDTGILLEYVDPSAFQGSSLWASKAENRGAAVHTFFYQETNFLEDAAKEYAVLEDDEVFRYRNIDDGSFIQDTLRFFTGKHGTDKDRETLEYQMENVVMELSRMVRRGEEMDFSKVQTKLTIAGAEVSFAQLMEFQKVGREINANFLGANMGTLDGGKISQAAQLGIAKAMGNLYGSERGEVGKMFSDGIDRLYEQAMANREKTAQNAFAGRVPVSSYNDSMKVELGLSDMFAKIDISNRENMTKSFQETMNRAKSSVLGYCYTYGGAAHFNPYGSMVNLNQATAQIQNFFQSWLVRIDGGK